MAYALWHCARHAPQLAPAVSQAALLSGAKRYARAALEGIASQPPERYGWSLLAGHAGVYATGALVFDAAAAAAEQQGRGDAADGLRAERERCVQRYAALGSLAASSTCQEDEARAGREPAERRWLQQLHATCAVHGVLSIAERRTSYVD